MTANWVRTDCVQFGVAICSFPGDNDHHLPLQFGDAVLIYEQTENVEWYRGCPLINRTLRGIFPVSHVAIKWRVERVNTNDAETNATKELAIVLEITSVLREWGELWKQLYVKNKMEKINYLRPLMTELMNHRRQIMSGTLTTDQLKQFRTEIAYTIDYGNKYLGLDLVVRDNEGNVIDVDATGVIDLYKRHLEPRQRTEITPGEFRRSRLIRSQNVNQYNVHNLYVAVKNVVCKVGEDADVFITLFDGAPMEMRFITEHYVIGWNKNGMPKDLDKLHNLTCLFTELGNNDLEKERLYIICQIIRDGTPDAKSGEVNVSTQKLRRPFGVAVLHISDIVKGIREENINKEMFLPLQLLGNEDVETVIRRVIQKIPAPSQGSGQGIWMTLQMLHGDVHHVREENPLLVNQFTSVARKQDFPDVIMPGDVRNDLYLTLLSGTFEKGAKTSNKNIQVTVGVYDSNGTLLEDVVSVGAGHSIMSEHFSTVYYHTANPKWNEVVKLSIPIEKVTVGSTIRFAFKHRSTIDEKEKPERIFSISYVHLVNTDGTCLQDGDHELAVYKCEDKKADDSIDATSLLKLFSLKSEATSNKKNANSGNLQYNKTDSFMIRTKLCSTKLAQNVNLLDLLKWKSQKNDLPNILRALVKVSGEEIVKFLQDTFDALFAILMHNPQQYGVLVYDAVVFCIGLLADKKYHRFRPILDAYIENLFSSTKAYITFINVLRENLLRVESQNFSPDMHERLKKNFKALEYVVKFIVRSRELSESATPGVGAAEFQEYVRQVFQTMLNIMNLPNNNNLVIIKGYALKYIPALFKDLLYVYDPYILGCFAKDLIESLPPDTLLTQKMTCMHQIVKSPLFQNPISRERILPMLIYQIKTHMEKFSELQICADILNDMLSCFNLIEMGETDDDIEYIVLNLFRCNVETVIRMDLKNQIVGNYVTFIISMLDLMKERHYLAYINSYKDDNALLDGLMELFLVFREFVKGNVYPADWVAMTMIQNNVILGALQCFSEYALYEKFLVGDNFQLQVWDNYFQLAVAFITQDSLQLEEFSESKRNNILEKYSDMRTVMANRIMDMWYRLGRNKIRLMSHVVRPFLEMTLVPQTELRKLTLPLFYDLIDCEFRVRQHFKQVESDMIMHLDQLIESGMKGDEEYKELFNQILGDLFRNVKQTNARLSEVGLIFVETITRLLSRLLDYRSVISSEDNINNRMSCNVNILNFYQDIKREEMKERYLYKLCDLHISVKSYTEAGFTLLLHAELLKWVDEPLSQTSASMTSYRYNVTSQRELKEQLYLDAIDYFDKGKMWEYGISRCKELAQQYELETYEYEKLSSILERQAKYFEKIVDTVVRPEPTYFRVGYFGRGFPTFLRNKLFIQRGEEFEKLTDFTMQLRVLYPMAQFVNTLEHPGEEITQSIQQWIQVCKVDPQPVERRRFRGKNVSDQIKKFYEVNDVSEFALNRPFHKGTKNKENEFATLWIERITMNTEYSFPGKLRWFEVTSINTIELSPIENAVDTMRTKNKELNRLLSQHFADPSLNYNNLSMVLNGTIDAAVMGGYANYEKIFFSKEYIASHPDEMSLIDSLKQCIVEQVDLCEKGLLIHKRLISKELEPFQKKMEAQLRENKIKALPYRKNEDGRNAMLSGDRKVFGGNKSTNKSSSWTENIDYTGLSSNRERNTIIGNSCNIKMSDKRGSGYRHTAVVGISPSGEYAYGLGYPECDDAPFQRNQPMTMTLGRLPKHSLPNKLVGSDNIYDVFPSPVTEEPPVIPRKQSKIQKNPTSSIENKSEIEKFVVKDENDEDEDDEPPPLLPKKTTRSKIVDNSPICHNYPITPIQPYAMSNTFDETDEMNVLAASNENENVDDSCQRQSYPNILDENPENSFMNDTNSIFDTTEAIDNTNESSVQNIDPEIPSISSEADSGSVALAETDRDNVSSPEHRTIPDGISPITKFTGLDEYQTGSNENLQISDDDRTSVIETKIHARTTGKVVNNDGNSPMLTKRITPSPESRIPKSFSSPVVHRKKTSDRTENLNQSDGESPLLRRKKYSRSENLKDNGGDSNLMASKIPQSPKTSPKSRMKIPVAQSSKSTPMARTKIPAAMEGRQSPNSAPISRIPKRGKFGAPSQRGKTSSNLPVMSLKIPINKSKDVRIPMNASPIPQSPSIPLKKSPNIPPLFGSPVVPPPYGSSPLFEHPHKHIVSGGERVYYNDHRNYDYSDSEGDDVDTEPPPIPPREKAT